MRAVLAASVLLLGGALAAASPDAGVRSRAHVLARIDADSVTTVELLQLLSSLPRPRPGSPDYEIPSADKVLRRLIQNRLLEQEGYRMGAQEDPMVRNQVWELTRHRAMIALLDSVAAEVEGPEEEALSAAFDRESVMHRVAHILVDGEDLAAALLDSLAAGASFDELSRHHSLDSARADTGGDLGWARADLYVPEFRSALEGLAPGEFAGPVKSEQGWHVLRLTETRTETAGQSDAMRKQLQEATARERVRNRIREFVEELKREHGVVLEDSLVASLDYGSEDPAVMQRLRDSDAVVATFPWRSLTVGELTRRILFEHFHGIQGKPEAAAIRDKVFDEWVTELLLRHEAAARGFDRKPVIVAAADELERRAIREIVIKSILDRPFDPTDEEVERFYREHPESFTPVPRVRAQGAYLADPESARRFREKVESGADVAWLAARADGVVDAAPAALAGWVSAASLGLEPADVRVGSVLGPVAVEEGWAVARIAAMEPVEPRPLSECRDRVVAMMTNERSEEVVSEAIRRLEEQAEIRIESGAPDEVTMWIDEWAGVSTTPSSR
jgi:peptidyl-prolyl cis-trans isomerase C